jgi:hypothetical protein
MGTRFNVLALSVLGITCLAFLAITAYSNDVIPNDGILPIGEQEVGATITTINATDTLKDSRAVINTNFANLNTDKLERSDYFATTSHGKIVSIPNLSVTESQISDLGTYLTSSDLTPYLTIAGYIGTTTLAARTATTTGVNGIDISGGCFAIDGTCVSGGAGGSIDGSGTANQLAVWSDSDTLAALAAGTKSYVLMSSGSGVSPTWISTSTLLWDNDFTANGIMYRAGPGSYQTTSTISVRFGGTGLSAVANGYTLRGNGREINATSTVFVSDSSKVGIRNINPAYTLDVTGTANVSGKLTISYASSTGITATNFWGTLIGNSQTATALAADPSDCAAGTAATAIAANGNLTCGITPLISGGTLTSSNVCQYDGTGVDCNLTTDGSGDCGSGAVCLGDHTHTTYVYTAGDNITLTGNDFDVDDAFILNTGDVGTGVYDFGGATKFEIPNGAGPRADTAGNIVIDTTSDQVRYFGTATRTIPYLKTACWTFASSTSLGAGTTTLAGVPYGITVTEQNGLVNSGTSIKLKMHDGTNLMTSMTATATRSRIAPAANNTWTAREDMKLSWSNGSGTVYGFNYCIYYTVTAD